MGRPANKPENIWNFIDKRGEHECWPWIGAKSKKGYGVIGIKHRVYRVNRIVCWFRDSGSISLRATPNGHDRKIALHSCDNPTCCNPKHLSVGLPKDNTQDMIKKGRRACTKGEMGGSAKLSHEDVQRIRETRLFGAKQKDLAAIYGVSGPTISTTQTGGYYDCVPNPAFIPRNKLTTEEAFFIRLQKKAGATSKALCMLYDVKKDVIKDLLRGRTYREAI
jgi:hypothetical protein